MRSAFSATALLAPLLFIACGAQQPDMSSQPRPPSPEDLRAYFESPEHKRAVEEALARMERDNAVVEDASWFGRTGLDEGTERELPRYLRREFGEFLDEPNALKASDLTYLGTFNEEDGEVHYWELPYHDEVAYAYVVESPHQTHMGWGNRVPLGAKSE